jgi:hypothetical protein
MLLTLQSVPALGARNAPREWAQPDQVRVAVRTKCTKSRNLDKAPSRLPEPLGFLTAFKGQKGTS